MNRTIIAWLYVAVALADLVVLLLFYGPHVVGGAGFRWIPGFDSGLPIGAEFLLIASIILLPLYLFKFARVFILERALFRVAYFVVAAYSLIGCIAFGSLRLGYI